MHGGLSTGARTPEGQARARAARFVHGGRTAEIIDFRAAAARSARRLATLTRLAREATAPAGHGVHRSVSRSPLGQGTVVARAEPTPECLRSTKLAGKSTITRLLRVFAPLRFNSPAPLHRLAGTRRQAI
jgi:hypothetical protein